MEEKEEIAFFSDGQSFIPHALGPIVVNDGENELHLFLEGDKDFAAELSVEGRLVAKWDLRAAPIYFEGWDSGLAGEALRRLLTRVMTGQRS